MILFTEEASNIQLGSSNEYKLIESNENTFGGVIYDNQSIMTPGLISPENIISREIIVTDDNIISYNLSNH